MSFSITLLYRKFTYPLTQNMPSFTKVHISSHQNMSFFKGSSTENKHIFPHKPLLSKTLPRNIHISSHTKHVFSITLLYRNSFILSPKTCLFTCLLSQRFTYPLTKLSPKICLFACLLSQGITYPLTKPMPFFNFSMALPHKIQFTYLPTQTMPSFKGTSTDNSHIFPHKPCLLSKALPQITHISSHTDHALFQRLFHRKFTHPLTQHMSFYMSSFNETKAAYVKELPRKVNPV